MDSSSESETELNCSTPPDTIEDVQEIDNLPERSKDKYMAAYEHFISWTVEKQISVISEDAVLSYFEEKVRKNYKPSSLWCTYSMLKCTLFLKNNINIREYIKLTAFLKRESIGFKSKKTRMLTAADMDNFLLKAPDDKYLGAKVVLILGVNGACNCQELADITLDDLEIHGNMMLVKIRDVKTKLQRSFVISDDSYEIVKKYKELRPNDINTRRFLLQFRDDQMKKQVMGRNNISAVPKKIAKFLNLPKPDEYTGHCYRRSAAMLHLQTSSWKSNSKIAKQYNLAKYIAPSPVPSTSCQSPPVPELDCLENDEKPPLWAQELERQRVQAAQRQAAAAERQAAATERASERQTAAIEMLAVRLAASAEQQAASLASINYQLNDIKNYLRQQ